MKEKIQKLKSKNKSHVALRKRLQTKIKILEQKVLDTGKKSVKGKSSVKGNKKQSSHAYRSDEECYD